VSTPIGARQSVRGGGNSAFWRALKSFSASSGWMSAGTADNATPAARHTCPEACELTRGKRAGQEHAHRAMGAVVHQPGEDPQLNAVRMRLDLDRFGRELLGGAGEAPLGAVGCQEREFRVWIGDGGLFQVLVHRLAAAEERGLHRDVDLGPRPRITPIGFLVHEDHRLVALEVHAQLVVVRRLGFERAAGDLDGFGRRDLAVHAGRRDPDALLAAAHPQAVELGAVQEFPEDAGDLGLHDSGPIVAHRKDIMVLCVLHFPDFDPDSRQDAGFLAGVQRIVDGFLDRRQERFAGIVEPQHVPVLGEEVRDRNFLLLFRHRLGVGSISGHGGSFLWD
jgi:hypothetical protein